MSLWLSEDELIVLTGYKQRKMQREALARLGVPFQSRPADGFPLVRRADHEQPSQGKPRRRHAGLPRSVGDEHGSDAAP